MHVTQMHLREEKTDRSYCTRLVGNFTRWERQIVLRSSLTSLLHLLPILGMMSMTHSIPTNPAYTNLKGRIASAASLLPRISLRLPHQSGGQGPTCLRRGAVFTCCDVQTRSSPRTRARQHAAEVNAPKMALTNYARLCKFLICNHRSMRHNWIASWPYFAFKFRALTNAYMHSNGPTTRHLVARPLLARPPQRLCFRSASGVGTAELAGRGSRRENQCEVDGPVCRASRAVAMGSPPVHGVVHHHSLLMSKGVR